MMRVCFIGLGSIAERHIRNLKEISDDISVTVFRREGSKGRDQILESGKDTVVREWCDLDRWYDAIFITNPTSMHYQTLVKCYGKSGAFFLEKPVFMTGHEDISIFDKERKEIYTACPLRYTKIIQYIREHVDFHDVYSVRSISSSYLPDWRTGIDYRNIYSAHKSMGGGVSLDLIHEWDYIHSLMGMPCKASSIISKKSNMDIDSDDVAVYIAEYEGCLVEIHLDYFGRFPQRYMELFCRNEVILVDFINQTVRYRMSGKTVTFTESRNDYQKRELEHFLDIMRGKVKNNNTLEEACAVLRLARGEA